MYWDKKAETLSRSSLEKLQIKKLKQTLKRSLRSTFYRKLLKEAGVSFDSIKDVSDIREIPFTTKQDLRNTYPYGMLCVPKEKTIRLHASSGTTGTSTVIFHTPGDIDNWTELLARCIFATGCDSHDVFQNMMTYGMFTGGLGLHYGAEKVGMLVIPASSGNTKRQIKFMRDFGTTVLHITPSYLLHISDVLSKEEKIDPRELNLKAAYIGAEPHSETTRKKLEAIYGFHAYNSYGLSEMNGPGVAFECTFQKDMHIWEDHYIVEVIDPETGKNLPDGQEGELVLTTLSREAMPILRYRTRDLTRICKGNCPCGRTHRRIARIKGRTDDLLIVGGVNVFPSQVEHIIMKIAEVGTNYEIHLQKKGALDHMTVKVELNSKMFSGDIGFLNSIREKIAHALKDEILIRPTVELVAPGTLEPSMGKARRVYDNRKKL
ncbi:MAG: phenylacetate--CoA ligase [Candidatus Aureabacteria bacterium]|nr:phenylacetate--CoA ligase [Candidatus Auribacterota bacterium]